MSKLSELCRYIIFGVCFARGAVVARVRYDGTTVQTIADKDISYDGGLLSLGAEVTVVSTAYVRTDNA
jgi:hypothetical protein